MKNHVESLDPTTFATPDPASGYARVLDDADFAAAVECARAQHPIEHYAFLRGLCRGHLRRCYERTGEPVRLLEGLPLPFASRRIDELYAKDATPFHRTQLHGHLLDDLGFDLYPFGVGDGPTVLLDYACGEQLDTLGMGKGPGALPTVGTLHLPLGKDDRAYTLEGSRVFDVKPRRWSREAVLAQLERLRSAGAEIALLPELCLPSADALEASLAAEPTRYPSLVVAGSAHVRDRAADGREIRANESRVYLNGRCVLVHRKIHGLTTRSLGDARSEEPIVEDLTPEPKPIRVLSGQQTRLGVVICSDLIDRWIPRLLEAAGVNLLLVPAMTYGAGSFNGTVTGIASNCQGVTVIANADLEPTDRPDGSCRAPFLLLVGVPRPDPHEQSRAFRDDAVLKPPCATVDPNRRLGEAAAVRWLDVGAQAR